MENMGMQSSQCVARSVLEKILTSNNNNRIRSRKFLITVFEWLFRPALFLRICMTFHHLLKFWRLALQMQEYVLFSYCASLKVEWKNEKAHNGHMRQPCAKSSRTHSLVAQNRKERGTEVMTVGPLSLCEEHIAVCGVEKESTYIHNSIRLMAIARRKAECGQGQSSHDFMFNISMSHNI